MADEDASHIPTAVAYSVAYFVGIPSSLRVEEEVAGALNWEHTFAVSWDWRREENHIGDVTDMVFMAWTYPI